MSKLSTRVVLFLVMGGVAAIASQAHADTCKAVDIKVDNTKDKKILALSVDIKTREEGSKVRSEAFANKEVAANTLGTVATNQNLSGIEGYTVTSLTLHYKVWCGGKWSVEKTYTDTSLTNPVCTSNSGKSYRITLPSPDGC